MYKWRVEYILKSGDHLIGTYIGNESDTAKVTKVLLDGNMNTFNAVKNLTDDGTLLVRNECIAAIDISIYKEKK